MKLFTKKIHLTREVKLQVFQHIFSWRKLKQKLSWTAKIKYVGPARFRSLFGFLKPKPFIYQSRLFFLKYLTLNPRPRSFQRWVSKTKSFRQHHYPNPDQQLIYLGVSYLSLNHYLKKIITRKFNIFKYELFKHKIFKYTTAKLVQRDSSLNIASKVHSIDFRTGLLLMPWPTSIPNSDTISTYNWKSIN